MYLIDIYYSLTKTLYFSLESIIGFDCAGIIENSNADIDKAKNDIDNSSNWSLE